MDLGAGRGRKKGELTDMGTVADSGMRRGAQRRATEAGGWRARVTTRWEALHTGRGGGERVKRDGFENEQLRMGRR